MTAHALIKDHVFPPGLRFWQTSFLPSQPLLAWFVFLNPPILASNSLSFHVQFYREAINITGTQVAGLMLGSSGEFSSWLLAATVGVFLYVALVSMLSEIKAASLFGILLNTLGMVGGALLLLGIGLYEPQLEAFFGGEHDH